MSMSQKTFVEKAIKNLQYNNCGVGVDSSGLAHAFSLHYQENPIPVIHQMIRHGDICGRIHSNGVNELWVHLPGAVSKKFQKDLFCKMQYEVKGVKNKKEQKIIALLREFFDFTEVSQICRERTLIVFQGKQIQGSGNKKGIILRGESKSGVLIRLQHGDNSTCHEYVIRIEKGDAEDNMRLLDSVRRVLDGRHLSSRDGEYRPSADAVDGYDVLQKVLGNQLGGMCVSEDVKVEKCNANSVQSTTKNTPTEPRFFVDQDETEMQVFLIYLAENANFDPEEFSVQVLREALEAADVTKNPKDTGPIVRRLKNIGIIECVDKGMYKLAQQGIRILSLLDNKSDKKNGNTASFLKEQTVHQEEPDAVVLMRRLISEKKSLADLEQEYNAIKAKEEKMLSSLKLQKVKVHEISTEIKKFIE